MRQEGAGAEGTPWAALSFWSDAGLRILEWAEMTTRQG